MTFLDHWIPTTDLLPGTGQDWVLVKLTDIVDGHELVPSVAEIRSDGKWYAKESEGIPLENYTNVVGWKPLDLAHASDAVKIYLMGLQMNELFKHTEEGEDAQ